MSDTLFDELGGAGKVSAMVDTMYAAVMNDEELSPFFANTDMERLRRMQYEFLASALGGPSNYAGAELQKVHAGRGITARHFARFFGHLADAMEAHGASKDQVDSMLGKVAMYRDRITGGANVDG